jgi:hypothetical protein
MVKVKFFARKLLYYFSPLNTFMRKGKDPDPKPDPGGLKHTDPTDPDPDENPEHCRGGYYITLQYVGNFMFVLKLSHRSVCCHL